MSRMNRQRRGAALTLEAAIVLPVMLVMLFGLMVGGMGVFRYQQVACLAHEAARYASVRGSYYQNDTGQSSPTTAQILQTAVLPMLVGMDPDQLSITVQWINQGSNTAYDWDTAPKSVKSINSLGEYVTNSVRVTVTYQWSPGIFVGSVTMTSVSELPMSS
jgi:Flp pilus assembly protein TadG